jgi:hypothetical protein
MYVCVLWICIACSLVVCVCVCIWFCFYTYIFASNLVFSKTCLAEPWRSESIVLKRSSIHIKNNSLNNNYITFNIFNFFMEIFFAPIFLMCCKTWINKYICILKLVFFLVLRNCTLLFKISFLIYVKCDFFLNKCNWIIRWSLVCISPWLVITVAYL